MQKVLDKPSKRTKADAEGIPQEAIKSPIPPPSQIKPARMAVITVPIRGMQGSPLVVNAFSAKAREKMRLQQEMGSLGKKVSTKRDPKDFADLYNSARHISREGWDGMAAATIRNAAISACRLVGFKMTLGRLSLFTEADGISAADGTPLIRIYGEPQPFEAMVRNQTGVADIRIRPRWDEWTANLRLRFDQDQFSDEDIIHLLYRAGTQCGICEGRPDSTASNGLGWGLFEIDTSQPIALETLAPPDIKIVRK